MGLTTYQPKVEIRLDPATSPLSQYTQEFTCGEDWVDEVVEAVRHGRDDEARRIVLEEVKCQARDAAVAGFHPLLSYITEAVDARFAADVAAYSSRLRVRDGWTGSTLAQKYGVSRTTARSHIEKFCAQFGLPVPDERGHTENAISNRRNEKLTK